MSSLKVYVLSVDSRNMATTENAEVSTEHKVNRPDPDAKYPLKVLYCGGENICWRTCIIFVKDFVGKLDVEKIIRISKQTFMSVHMFLKCICIYS